MRYIFGIIALTISNLAMSDIYLICPWEGYSDYINLTHQKTTNGDTHYSKGEFYRDTAETSQNLSFKVKNTCSFNCVFPTTYTMLRMFQLDRASLALSDRSQVIVGGDIVTTQCKSVAREEWKNEKSKDIKTKNKI